MTKDNSKAKERWSCRCVIIIWGDTVAKDEAVDALSKF